MSHLRLGVVHVHVLDCRTSWPVAVVWVVLSFLVALAVTVGFVQSEWFVREDYPDGSVLRYDRDSVLYTLGLFTVCYRDLVPRDFSCHTFGVATDIAYFPSVTWQTTCILYGSGCVLFLCAAAMSIFSFVFFEGPHRRVATALVGHVQGMAAFVQTAALLMYPAVLGTQFGRLHCGPGAYAYSPDSCRLGWSYMLAISGTVLGYYCPVLAHFSSYNVYGHCWWNSM